MSKSVVVVVLCVAILSPAQAGLKEFLFGTPEREISRTLPQGGWDFQVRDPRTGDVALLSDGLGGFVTYHPDMGVRRGQIVVLRPLIASGDRRMGRLALRSSGMPVLDVLFPENPRVQPVIRYGEELAHLINPPGWEVGNCRNIFASKDADEDVWTKTARVWLEVRRHSRCASVNFRQHRPAGLWTKYVRTGSLASGQGWARWDEGNLVQRDRLSARCRRCSACRRS